MRLARIRAPEHDQVGVLDLLVGARTATCAEYRRQTDDARSVSSSIAAVDVVAADDRAGELLGDVIHLVGRLRAAKHAKRTGAAAIPSVAQAQSGALERLFPRRATQITVAHERMRQPKIRFTHGRVIRPPSARSHRALRFGRIRVAGFCAGPMAKGASKRRRQDRPST